MVETIVPVVHGGRRSRYWLTVALHALGAGTSAALMGAVLGSLGDLAGAPWGAGGTAALAALAGIYALRELIGLPVPVPQLRRQVPEWWRTFFSPAAAAGLYGLGLGVGFFTFLSYGTLVAVAAAALASGNALVGAGLCAPFGIARALAVTVAWRAETAESAAAVADGLDRMAATPLPGMVNAIALSALVAAAIVAAV
jgi:hypothetical protein